MLQVWLVWPYGLSVQAKGNTRKEKKEVNVWGQ